MGRPRQRAKDLPPGLYCYKGRSCYIQLGEMKPVPLDTQDKAEALAIYWEFRKTWDAQQAERQAEALAQRLAIAAKGGDVMTVAAYARHWRETYLPRLLRKNGKPLADDTREAYGRILEHQVEADADLQRCAIGAAGTRDLRQFLARWIATPNYYNHIKAVLSRMFQQAVDVGLLDSNPVANVTRRTVKRRDVYCPMEHYLAITAALTDWQARACDLVYLISHRPGDVLALEDRAPFIRYEMRADPKTGEPRKVVVVSFTPTKNEQAIEIVDDVATEGGIESALQWFRDWKKAQELVTPRLVVFPRGSRRRDVGRPVSVDYLSRRLAEAVVAAGLGKGAYQLRDLRKKGLTDEARIAGKATNKGAHKTQAMREYYVVGGVPARHRNQLTVLRGKG